MKPASTIITELRGGMANEALTDAIQEATERVKATGKKAQVILTLTIEPADVEADEVERVWVQDEVKCKLPKLPQKNTLFFIDPENNNLSRKDPQQAHPALGETAGQKAG